MPESTNNPTIPYFWGHKIPIGSLPPIGFEAFVTNVLVSVGETYGIKDIVGKGGNGDSGFDAEARDINCPDYFHCIQCKRWEANSFNIAEVAHEVIKVALTTYIEKKTILKHWFVCSNKTTGEVRDLSRDRTPLKSKVSELITNQLLKNEVKELVSSLSSGTDISQIVQGYIDRLDSIVSWNGQNFDDVITQHYSRLLPIIERFFILDRVVREYPRPNFNRVTYGSKMFNRHKSVADKIRLRVNISSSPHNIEITETESVHRQVPPLKLPTDESIELNLLTFLTGPGGAGKTTYLRQIAFSLSEGSTDDLIPVIVDLEKVHQQSLQDRIRAELSILPNDNWKSLPLRYLLLIDGFDSLDFHAQRSVINQIADLGSDSVYVILAIRESGPRFKLTVPFDANTIKMMNVAGDELLAWLDREFDNSQRNRFLDEFKLINSLQSREIFLIPYWFSKLIETFQKDGSLGRSLGEIVDTYLASWYQRNQFEAMQAFDFGAIRNLLSTIAYGWRFRLSKPLLTREELLNLISDSLHNSPISNPGIYVGLTASNIFELLRKNDMLYENTHSTLRFEHDITLDYLAGHCLGRLWRESISSLKNSSKSDDAWVFGSRGISRDDARVFISTVYDISPELAVSCALERRDELFLGFVEESLIRMFTTGIGYEQSRAAHNLGRLGTPGALKALHKCVDHPVLSISEPSKSTPVGQFYAAKRALAFNGDIAICYEILVAADRQDVGFGTAAGGDIELWSIVPRALSVELASKRIRGNDNQLNTTIQTLGLWADKSSFDAIVAVLQNRHSVINRYRAIRALYRIDPARAIKEFAGQLGTVENAEARVYLNEIHFSFTGQCEVDWLLTHILANAANEREKTISQPRARDLLARIQPPDNAIERIREVVSTDAYSDSLSHAWVLAAKWQIDKVEAYVLSGIRSSNHRFVQYAALYVAQRQANPENASMINVAIERLQHSDDILPYRAFDVLLDCCISSADSALIKDRAELKLKQIIKSFRTKNRGEQETIGDDSKVVIRYPDFAIQTFVQPLTRCIALIDTTLLTQLLEFNLTSLGIDEQLRQLLGFLSQADIENSVANTTDLWAKLHVLSSLKRKAWSSKIQKVFEALLPVFVNHVAASVYLREIISAQWNDAIAESTIKFIAGHDFGPDVQIETRNIFSSGIVSDIVEKLDPEQCSKYLLPVIHDEISGASTSILKYIRDASSVHNRHR